MEATPEPLCLSADNNNFDIINYLIEEQEVKFYDISDIINEGINEGIYKNKEEGARNVVFAEISELLKLLKVQLYYFYPDQLGNDFRTNKDIRERIGGLSNASPAEGYPSDAELFQSLEGNADIYGLVESFYGDDETPESIFNNLAFYFDKFYLTNITPQYGEELSATFGLPLICHTGYIDENHPAFKVILCIPSEEIKWKVFKPFYTINGDEFILTHPDEKFRENWSFYPKMLNPYKTVEIANHKSYPLDNLRKFLQLPQRYGYYDDVNLQTTKWHKPDDDDDENKDLIYPVYIYNKAWGKTKEERRRLDKDLIINFINKMIEKSDKFPIKLANDDENIQIYMKNRDKKKENGRLKIHHKGKILYLYFDVEANISPNKIPWLKDDPNNTNRAKGFMNKWILIERNGFIFACLRKQMVYKENEHIIREDEPEKEIEKEIEDNETEEEIEDEDEDVDEEVDETADDLDKKLDFNKK